MKMNKRTLTGILCALLAALMIFVISPVINGLSDPKKDVLRVKRDVREGELLGEEDIESVRISASAVPKDALRNPSDAIGMRASGSLYALDILTPAKLGSAAGEGENILEKLDGTKVALSINIENFASGLSGKLEKGDVVSLIFTDRSDGKSLVPPELKYVYVITTTTSGGIDKEDIVKNEDGSSDAPSTLTLLVSEYQAEKVSAYGAKGTLSAALVYRGPSENTEKFLSLQDEYLEKVKEEQEKEEAPCEPTEEGAG